MKRQLRFWLLLIGIGCMLSCEKEQPKTLDLSQANIVISAQIKSPIQETAANILIEEIKKRTDLQLGLNQNWDSNITIALALAHEKELFGAKVPAPEADNASELKKEGYRLFHVHEGDKNTLWIIGADERGILYGIGKLLRTAKMSKSQITLSPNIDYSEAPEYALRGHQFGYRNTANSWDAWTVEQFDQHFREQVLFGANSFENIPFQEANSSPHFKIDPQIMEVELSKICQKYDADYWVWTPAPHDLTIKNAHADGLAEQEAFYAKCPRLDGVFVPGGDPGENHPAQLIPYLNDLSEILHKYHPNAGIWVSLQGFNKEKVDYFFNYLDKESPDWLKGVVYGPSSPPIDLEREMLPKKYLHRFYPDITHTVRCHYPVDNWDQAYALTLGREPINPQPLMYTQLFNRDTKYTDGFITYSDGSHDDVNKVLWSQLGWDSKKDPKTIIQEYTQFFFGPKVAEEAAQGIFNLEKNWDGPILENNSIKETLALWKGLEENNPDLANNWRWQQLIMRAYYDAYIQDRLAYEKRLEDEAYEILAQANTIGADKAMSDALQHIKKADTELVSQDLKEKVFEYGEKLFRSIGAQTSVEKYQARGAERGAILDFIDYPLNNRWWLEDEFNKIGEFKSEADKLARLEFIKNYESPGEGSFYDNISSADAKHVTSKTDDAIDFLWENDGISRKRLSTQLFQFTPTLEYHDLDPDSDYLIRVSGYGEALLRANGERLKPTKYEKGFEEFKEFPLPKNLIKDGLLKISFDKPDEEHLNWRKQSRVTDVWLIKQP
ncbi:alpha-glucuronidase family glycosyl hydrolase [Arenibacter troitsensis]|uniref:Glycosyl hydrolase family 67 N-terminus n=1 Tax=Arenibacter troitsensis TaxID=188872 RepID=A0A1X7L8F4_9FLAO|nr:alpha-glucuronidase family glycosyl hydrolase [Arenibacter troitsensis]SMG49837.1 Glycosyl hydrolase family 67 N-terminus [Arenibacter troitsensis]